MTPKKPTNDISICADTSEMLAVWHQLTQLLRPTHSEEHNFVSLGAKEYSPDGHHAEGDVARGHVVGAADFVDLVRFGHHHRVMLHHHSVGVHSALLGKRRCRNVMASGEVFILLIIAG